MRRLLPVLLLAAACSSGGGLRWYENCGGCGAPIQAPDGGWGPGTCTTQKIGDPCEKSGEGCTVSGNPCVSGLVCTDKDPAPDCPILP